MKNKPWIRFLSMFLLLALVICFVPSVFASDSAVSDAATEAELSTAEEDNTEVASTESGTNSLGEDVSELLSEDGESLTRAAVNLRARAATGSMGKSTCVTFSAYTSPYWYCNRYYTDGSHSYGHYYYTSEIAYHTIDDELAFCIEPNTASIKGQPYTSYEASGASEDSYWMKELDATQRLYITYVMAFGYPSVDNGCSKQVQYAATQTLIWEIASKQRYEDLYTCKNQGLYTKIKTVLGADYANTYQGILDSISIYDGTCPSFASEDSSGAPTVKLTLNSSTNCYEATVTDSNAVLSNYTFALEGATFTKSGNKLTISVPVSSATSVKGKTVTCTSTQKDMSTSNPLIWENSTYQTVLTAGGADYATAYFKLDWEDTGSIKIIKKVSDSSVSVKGWTFYFTNNSTGETVTKTTDASGNITLTDLTAGVKYTVSEKAVDGYYQVPSQTVTIEAGKTTELTFTNKPLVGNLTVSKAVNYGSWKGFKMRLYGTSTIGKAVDVTVTTDENGVASFTGIYVGTYTLEEVSPGDQYISPEAQTATITANATSGVGNTTSATVTNTWKHWRATVTKVDAENTTKQGNADLDGAEYTLYKNGTAVATYTIKNRTFTTDYFPCTESNSVYTLKETKAPEGYTLDSTVYKLTTSYSDYSQAENTIKVTVSDTVVKGQIQIEKYALNTVSGEKQAEKGATFLVWIKSAGSYAKAKTSEKDVITIGSDGKGISKSLPYGTYCVQQATGWNGYVLDDTVYEVSISQNGITVVEDTSGNELVIYNDIWTGELSIVKVDGDTEIPLPGAEFTLTGSNGSEVKAVTDEDGRCIFSDLVYGVTYTWTETSAPKGYLLNESNTGTWTVDENNAEVEITCENFKRPGSITVTKQNTEGDLLPGCTFLLEYLKDGTWTPVSSRADSIVTAGGCTSPNLKNGCLTTDETGTVTFEGLLADGSIQYRLTEVDAPEGYSLLTEPVYEGTLPVSVALKSASDGYDEVIEETAYFYTLPITVCDGHIYVLPQTGGDGLNMVPFAFAVMAFGAVLCICNMKPYWYRRLCGAIKNL